MMKRLFAFLPKNPTLTVVMVLLLLLVPEVAFAQNLIERAGSIFSNLVTGGLLALPTAMVYLMFTVVNFILWVAGMLFNVAVVLTVFQFATYFGNTEGIHAAWTVLRDLGNIVLLFGFIFMGLGTVLNLHEYTIKKALPGFIIFAVLLNFSLFASQAVIDVANVLSSSFYAQAMNNGGGCTNQEADDFLPCINDGIAGKVMQLSGVASVYSPQIVGDYFGDPMRTMTMLIGLTIFSAIAATVLFAGAIMFIFRATVLVFLMVLSPIGFAGMAVPPLQKLANDWWQNLIKNAFFAPVYILLVLIALKVAEGLVSNAGEGGGLAGALQNGGMASGQMILTFCLITGFMAFALVGAQKVGAVGAGYATKAAGGLALGSIGFVGRRTAGRVSNRLANDVLQNKGWAGKVFNAQKNPNIARLAYGTFNKGATASWSARGGPVGSALKGAGVDVGKPSKEAAHGFHGIEEKMVKDREDFYKKVKATEQQKGVATEYEAELKDIKKKREDRLKGQMEAIEEQRKKVKEARLKNDEALLERERAELERRVTEYNRLNGEDVKNSRGEVITPGDPEGKRLAARQKEVESRAKQWNTHAESEKTKEYTAGLDRSSHSFFSVVGGIEKHADHEAADKIRKNQGKSELDRALQKIKDESEKKGGGGGAPTPAPAPAPAAPAGGGKPAGGGGSHDDHAH